MVWEPTQSDIEWTRNLVAMIKDGGVWGQPGSQAIFTFFHSEKKYTLEDTLCIDQETVARTCKVLGILGWEKKE